MDNMEKVESLREKTGCTYVEAKAALEEAGGDLLDALCWLEQHGKVQAVGVACSTKDREAPSPEPETAEQPPKEPNPVSKGFRSLWDGLVSLLHKCNRTEVVVTNKSGEREFGVPLTLFIILLLVCAWIMAVAMVVIMFLGNRFSLEGELCRQEVNDALGKATEFAESVKEDVFSKDEE